MTFHAPPVGILGTWLFVSYLFADALVTFWEIGREPVNEDAYEVCRRVKRYHEKNGYGPLRSELGVSEEFVEALVKNGVISLYSFTESGPAIKVALTEKGYRMAESRRR